MRIFIRANPGAAKQKIEKINNETFRVSVVEPPMQGKANKAIVEVLAEYFDVAPSSVKMVSGFSSRNKVFEIYP